MFVPHLRNPIPEPGRGIPAEGADGGAAEPARQWHRNAVLHLPVLLQRSCTRSWGAQRLHQQDCVGVLGSGGSLGRWVAGSSTRCWPSVWFFPSGRRWRPSLVVQRRPWIWIRALGNFSYCLVRFCRGVQNHFRSSEITALRSLTN